MKITEHTTLAELSAYLTTLGNPFLTLMKAHPESGHTRSAILYLGGVGSFAGSGATEAEAIEAACAALRKTLNRVRDPALNKFRQTADEAKRPPQPCHGCSHEPADHPNDSGCQRWHAGPL